jgi:hypothetical protein
VEFLAAKIIEGAGRFRPSVNNRAYLLISIAPTGHEVIRVFVWNENDARCRINMSRRLTISRNDTSTIPGNSVNKHSNGIRRRISAAGEKHVSREYEKSARFHRIAH